jgi:hypothetical protein
VKAVPVSVLSATHHADAVFATRSHCRVIERSLNRYAVAVAQTITVSINRILKGIEWVGTASDLLKIGPVVRSQAADGAPVSIVVADEVDDGVTGTAVIVNGVPGDLIVETRVDSRIRVVAVTHADTCVDLDLTTAEAVTIQITTIFTVAISVVVYIVRTIISPAVAVVVFAVTRRITAVGMHIWVLIVAVTSKHAIAITILVTGVSARVGYAITVVVLTIVHARNDGVGLNGDLLQKVHIPGTPEGLRVLIKFPVGATGSTYGIT